jgi:aspartyl protease family protein
MSIQGSLAFVAITAAAIVVGVKALSPAVPSSAPVATLEVAANDQMPSGPERIGNGYASVTIERAPDNHYYAEAQVNGASVRFIVDTGATSVVLTREDAQRAGLGTGDFTATGIGAGGQVKLMPVTIDRLAVGPLTADHVPAMVAEAGLPVSLLGQSYLSRVESVSISSDKMVLR